MIAGRKAVRRLGCCAVAALFAGIALAQPPAPAQPAPVIGWVPKSSPVGAYVAPNRAWWKLADVLAMHAGEKSWSQPIVRNKDLVAGWHQLARGGRTRTVMSPDSRVALIVWAGRARVTIAGQPPFVATRGFEIDVPFRVAWSIEAIGDAPALWFEVHDASDVPIYPVADNPEKPAAIPGREYRKAIMAGGPGTWDETNRPVLDYAKEVIGGEAKATAFIAGDHLFVNNIRGRGTPTPPASNLGHFHIGYDEFWFIMEGNVDYQIEGVPFFTASPGDVVTAAVGRWHRASFGGPVGQMATRVAINPFPHGLHDYSEESGGRQ